MTDGTPVAESGGQAPGPAADDLVGLLASLLASANMPAIMPAPADNSAPTPAGDLSEGSVTPALNVQRVAGQLASSTPGARYGTAVTATATCPAEIVLVSGGGKVTTSDGFNLDKAVLAQSYASGAGTWTVVGVGGDGPLAGGQTLEVRAVALCAG